MSIQIPFLAHPVSKEVYLVTGTFKDVQLYEYEYQASRIASQLRQILARDDDPFTEGYGEILVYLEALQFHFEALEGQVPPGVLALKTWWEMVKGGQPVHETYLYMTTHVHGRIIREIRQAITRATRLWTSPVEKSFLELTEAEQADPN